MRKSSLITPFRIYDQFHDLDKFKPECNTFCEYKLITDKTRLLPFQFRRPASNLPFFRIWMRQACNDFYSRIIPKTEADFIKTDAWTASNTSFASGKAKLEFGPGTEVGMTGILTNGVKYRVKVVVSDYKLSFGYAIGSLIKNGATTIGTITGAGTYIFDFVASSADMKVTATITGAYDYLQLDEFSIFKINDYGDVNGDYNLGTNWVEILNADTEDIVSSCGPAFGSTLPCGKYYLVLKSAIYEDGELVDMFFFSEIFSVEDFLPEQSPYVLLEWFNSCDLQDVKYTDFDCPYKNRLYVDGPIAKPDYPATEEGTENGEKTLNITFQKCEKIETIIIIPAPEFVVDAIALLQLHVPKGTIKYYEALRDGQQVIQDYIAVSGAKRDINYIFQDCAAQIDLKLTLAEHFIDSACCDEIATEDTGGCLECEVTVNGIDDYSDTQYALGDDGDGTFTLYVPDPLNPGSWISLGITGTGPIVCVSASLAPQMYMDLGGNNYVAVPQIVSMVDNGTSITITGYALPGTALQFHFSFNGGSPINLPENFTSEDLANGITIPYSDLGISPGNGDSLACYFSSFDIYCEYGDSPSKTLTFEET